MADEEKIIFSVEVDNEEALKALENQTDKITELTNANERLRKEQKQVDTSTKEGLEERKRIAKVIASNTDQLKVEKAERNRLVKVVNTQSNSLAALRLENAKLLKQRANINTSTKKGQQAFEELTKEIKKNKDAINEAEEASGTFTGSVGNYAKANKEGAMSLIESAGGFGSMTEGIVGATKASIKFIATPIGAIIAALVLVLKGMYNAISRNESVLDTFAETWSGISNVLDEVTGKIGNVLKSTWALVKGEKTLKEHLADTGAELLGLGSAMGSAYEEGVKLKQLQTELTEANIANTKALATLNAEYEKQSSIADDNTRSFKEREEANKKAAQAARDAAQIEADSAALVLSEVNKRIEIAERNGSINRKLRQEQADAIAANIQAEQSLTKVIFDNEKVRRELKQDRLERDLDILIDGFDNQKTINEKIINNDEELFSKRADLLDRTQQLAQGSFDKQIETIKKFTKVSFDENQLLAEQDAVILNERIRNLGLSEIIEGRLLEIVRDRKTAIADLSEAEAELAKTRLDISSFKIEEDEALFDAEEIALDEAISRQLDADAELIAANEAKNEAMIEQDRQAAEERKQIALALADQAVMVANAAIGYAQSVNDKKRDQELANENLTQKEREAIEKKYAKKQQRLQITQALINGSLAIINALATQPFIPLGVAAAAAATAAVGFQVATIKNQTFADGGEVTSGVFRGASHSAGGIGLHLADGTRIAEVEGNEGFYVVNKRDNPEAIAALSAINSRSGNSFSTPVRFAQDGGEIEQRANSNQQITEAIQNTPIFVAVTDINEGQGTYANVINNGTV